jgi:hypothetical protein
MIEQCTHQFVWPRRVMDGHYYQSCLLCGEEYEYDWTNMRRVRSSKRQHSERALQVGVIDVETADVDVEDGSVEDQTREGQASEEAVSPDLDYAEAADTDSSTTYPAASHSSAADPGYHGPDRGSRHPEPDTASNVSATSVAASVPQLKLLLEPEPAYRVFVRNLIDLILSRSPAPVPTTSLPGPFWSDVFVGSDLPWPWFVESLLGHMILVTTVLILSQWWPVAEPVQRSIFDEHYVSYYTPPKSFPSLGSHSPRPRAQSKRLLAPARRPTIRVASEHAPRQGKEASLSPPELAPGQANKLKLKIGPNLPAPMMPLAATGRSRLNVPAGPTWVVAPAPDLAQGTTRRSGSWQASVVAPAPEIGGVSSARAGTAAAPRASIVGPAPYVPGSIRRPGSVNIGESAVVKPAPQLPMDGQGMVSGIAKAGLGNAGNAVVPPPPSVQGAGSMSAGWTSSLSTPGMPVVPPAPSVQGTGNAAGSGRAGVMSGGGAQVVPPAPSVQGGRSNEGSGRSHSIVGSDLQAVPPAPSMQGAGEGAGGGNSLSAGSRGNGGFQALPPSGSGSDGASSNGTNTVGAGSGGPSSDSASAAGGSSAAQGGSAGAGENGGAVNEQSGTTDNSREPATVEIPLHLIGPVLALPGSSYFSNYEVFIAERGIGKNRTELIKLVYVSLPYQRRLSEYSQSDWTLRKLRVTRDKSCDESLLQMTWPETDPRPDAEHAADSPALSPKDRKGMLPCYRTTADDYRRALSRH